MYHIYKGNKLVSLEENYRRAVNYVQKHRGCRMIYYPV
jgi:hypothetical protein